jgi:hypothetical protein
MLAACPLLVYALVEECQHDGEYDVVYYTAENTPNLTRFMALREKVTQKRADIQLTPEAKAGYKELKR